MILGSLKPKDSMWGNEVCVWEAFADSVGVSFEDWKGWFVTPLRSEEKFKGKLTQVWFVLSQGHWQHSWLLAFQHYSASPN